MDYDFSYWGVRDYEGVRFYIEPDTILNELCPYEKPKKGCPCPHKGLCKETYKKWKKFCFIPEGREGEGYEIVQRMFPKGLEVRPELTFVNANFIPSPMRFYKLMTLTNAVPLVIYGINLRHDYTRIFNMVRGSLVRPIYLCGNKDIPVPIDLKGE